MICVDSRQLCDHAVRLAALESLRHMHVHKAEHCLPEVAEIVVGFSDMALVSDSDAASTTQHGWQVMIVMSVDGAAGRTPGRHCVVEQCAVAFLHRLKPIKEVRPLFRVPRVGDRPPLQFVGILSV